MYHHAAGPAVQAPGSLVLQRLFWAVVVGEGKRVCFHSERQGLQQAAVAQGGWVGVAGFAWVWAVNATPRDWSHILGLASALEGLLAPPGTHPAAPAVAPHLYKVASGFWVTQGDMASAGGCRLCGPVLTRVVC